METTLQGFLIIVMVMVIFLIEIQTTKVTQKTIQHVTLLTDKEISKSHKNSHYSP